MNRSSSLSSVAHWIIILALLIAGSGFLVAMAYQGRETATCTPPDIQPEKVAHAPPFDDPIYLKACITKTHLHVGEQAMIVAETVNYPAQYPVIARNFSSWQIRQTDAGGDTAAVLKIVNQTYASETSEPVYITVEAVAAGDVQVVVDVTALLYPPEISPVQDTLFSHPLTIRVE